MPPKERVAADDYLEDLRECAAAAREERRRIRRSLHDSIGQQVTALLFGLNWFARYQYMFPERIAELNEIAGTLKKETALLVRSINPPDLEEWGMLASLKPKIEKWAEAHQFHFHSTGLGAVELGAATEIDLYRLVRAALLHSMRAPRTGTIELVLEKRPDHILAIVEDDGSDCEDPETKEIRQLAAESGVDAETEASPAGGSIVIFRIPV
jgi:signal transduction histidine kinase